MSQKSTSPPSSLMAHLHSESHKQSILSKFNKLRKSDLLCDITLVVEDVHFKAHKALLAASSEYFSVMFTAEDQIHRSTHQLDGMAPNMFAAVLEFIYSAQVSVEESATEQLLATAHRMEVGDLVKVLTDLTRSAAGVKCNDAQANKAEDAELVKRKRGRPRKDVGAPVTELVGRREPCESSEDRQAEDNPKTESQPRNEDPEEHQSRQSKRKINPPVKYKGYKVGNNTAGHKEPGKRGRKRKYPDTEARCEDCGKVFKSHLFLKIHQRTHTETHRNFTQKHTLLAHQRMHTGEKPFVWKSLPECAQCHHKFMDAAQLKKHVRTHTGEKPFTCEICGKCFTAKSTLQTHIRIHRGEKPYNCSICKKSFSDPSARRRHVASHSGKKPFTCSFCSLSFTRLDNLKTHTKSHNKERAAGGEASSDTAAKDGSGAPQEEVQNILHLQQYQLPATSEQELQVVVTEDVDHINFIPGQDHEISLISTEGEMAQSAPSKLTLLARPSGHVHNVALVTQGDVVDQTSQIHTISMLQGQMMHQAEQMHVITLSKEAMEQLQAHHGPAQPFQITQRPIQQLQVMHQPIQQLPVAQEPSEGQVSREQQQGRAIHVSSQSSQPISISQTSEQISNHHIQGQTFQIQSGTVSYLYTTGLPQES
uniref:Zinc finger and BTB domain containing 24 n=1 Tax=Pundamilia nyererei TaxID=303518 RepID=A0A3B4FNG6_9CICH